MQKVPYVSPIVGGRKVEHLHANIEALDVALTEEHIKKIEDASPLKLGFPYELIVRRCLTTRRAGISRVLIDVFSQGTGSAYANGYVMAGHYDKWPVREAIRPATQKQ